VTRLALLAILLLLLAWGFWRMVDGVIEALGGTTAQRARARGRTQSTPVKLVRDPVCGTWVSPRSARSLGSGPDTKYFCSDECRVKFQQRS
jgi:YHS domain-containing protein